MNETPGAESEPSPNLESLWQFAGQGLRSNDFNTAMVHFYRGEVSRSNTWRNRLDATTNWAVVTTGAALTFTFGAVNNTPLVIIIDTLFILLFLFIEARRYRYYELWTYRVRLMETNFFAGLLSPPFLPHSDWAEKVTESLQHPTFPISLGEAFGRRYRRNYAPILFILAFGWVLKVAIHPTPVNNLAEFITRSEVGFVPGWVMILIGFLFHATLALIGLLTVGMRKSQGEVFGESAPNWLNKIARKFKHATWEALETDVTQLPFWPHSEPRKQLVYIISDKADAVGKAVLQEIGRGVTQLQGTGMYTGQSHSVLMCAVSAAQTIRLKRLVYQIDPAAFVIVTAAQDIRGSGFRPLEA